MDASFIKYETVAPMTEQTAERQINLKSEIGCGIEAAIC